MLSTQTRTSTYPLITSKAARSKKASQPAEAGLNVFNELKKARQQAGLTQAQVAAYMQTAPSAVARLESGGGRGKHSPSLRTLTLYTEAVNCKLKLEFIAAE